jgi:hypothetical protein
LDQYTIKQLDVYWKSVFGFYSKQIVASTNFLRIYANTRISTIQSYENSMHIWMDSYQKILTQINSFYERYLSTIN